jgi:hypothetical protein
VLVRKPKSGCLGASCRESTRRESTPSNSHSQSIVGPCKMAKISLASAAVGQHHHAPIVDGSDRYLEAFCGQRAS